MLDVFAAVPRLNLFGLSDKKRLEVRVPTFALTIDGSEPRSVAERLADFKIHARDGHYYALAVTEHLSVEEHGGMMRVGPVHYNTFDEVSRFYEALKQIVV